MPCLDMELMASFLGVQLEALGHKTVRNLTDKLSLRKLIYITPSLLTLQFCSKVMVPGCFMLHIYYVPGYQWCRETSLHAVPPHAILMLLHWNTTAQNKSTLLPFEVPFTFGSLAFWVVPHWSLHFPFSTQELFEEWGQVFYFLP